MTRELVLATAMIAGIGLAAAAPAKALGTFAFDMKRSAALGAGCAANAKAHVTLQTLGFAERMTVAVTGFPAHTALDLFVIQVPGAPFGVAWYVGDLETDGSGRVTKSFVSRFNEETFAVAPGTAPAPIPHGSKDQATNPAFKPVHTFHVGAWFNSPADATRAGCPGTITPFNGEHTAGVQVLNTANFANNSGPLRRID